MDRHVRLEKGEIYRNRSGSQFRCDKILPDGAIMTNIESGWRLNAHVITQHDDSTIEWDYSTGGYFE